MSDAPRIAVLSPQCWIRKLNGTMIEVESPYLLSEPLPDMGIDTEWGRLTFVLQPITVGRLQYVADEPAIN